MAARIRDPKTAASGLRPRGGLSLGLLLLAGCGGLQGGAPRYVAGERGEGTAAESLQADGTIRFEDDPFASSRPGRGGGLVGGGGAESLIIPFEELGALPAPGTAAGEEGVLERSSELSLTMLRARAVAEELSRTSRVVVDPGPHTFGDRVRVRLESRNPFGELLELVPADDGLVVELTWEVTRWLPVEGHDRLLRRHWFKLPRWFTLDPDQDWWEETELPLELEGESGGLWSVRIGARLRCAGVRLGDEELPIHEITLRSGALTALPPGWQAYRADPLGTLERLAALPAPAADRHVLVCAALLEGRLQRQRGMELMLDRVATLNQDEGIALRRAITFCTALQWMTGLQEMSNVPTEWIAWRKRAGGGR